MSTPRLLATVAAAILALSTAALPVQAAGVCKAEHLSCATTMPLGGYCECTSRGTTEGGTVEARPTTGSKVNSTAGGCGAQPNSPGCRR